MTIVWLVWYHNPELGKREALWGIYASEIRAINECATIERDYGYTAFYVAEVVHK